MALNDQRISKEGLIVIKGQQYRSQEKNKEDAYSRLQDSIKSVTVVHKKRKPTIPTKVSLVGARVQTQGLYSTKNQANQCEMGREVIVYGAFTF